MSKSHPQRKQDGFFMGRPFMPTNAKGYYSACSAWIAKSRPGATRDADS
jgi:hypothetical protein